MPYKAVIDTNVLVSALLTPGRNAARILAMVRDKTLVPCYTAEIMEEYQEVLSRDKFGLPKAEVDALLMGIVRHGHLVDFVKSSFDMPDEDDRKFYDAATTADAFLITGNLSHYPEGPSVINPARFLERIETR
jgi:putative PIN family toxin of toxin-antitoxin system